MRIYYGTDHKSVVDLPEGTAPPLEVKEDCRIDLGSAIVPDDISFGVRDGAVFGPSTISDEEIDKHWWATRSDKAT